MFNAFDSIRDRRRNRQTYRQLSRLSDQMLADIGLTRHDLDALRRGRAAGPFGAGNR